MTWPEVRDALEGGQEFFEQGVLAFGDVGPVGDPTQATAARGKWYIAHTADRLARDVMEKLRGKA